MGVYARDGRVKRSCLWRRSSPLFGDVCGLDLRSPISIGEDGPRIRDADAGRHVLLEHVVRCSNEFIAVAVEEAKERKFGR